MCDSGDAPPSLEVDRVSLSRLNSNVSGWTGETVDEVDIEFDEEDDYEFLPMPDVDEDFLDEDKDTSTQVPTKIPFSRVHRDPQPFGSLERRCFLPGRKIHVKIIDVEQFSHSSLLYPNLDAIFSLRWYVIQITHGDYQWTVRRRFKHFKSLHDTLKMFRESMKIPVPTKHHRQQRKTFAARKQHLPKFPTRPEPLVRSDGMLERKKQLEDYLQNMLRSPQYRNHIETLKFFEVSHLSFVNGLGRKNKEGMMRKRTGGRKVEPKCCFCLPTCHCTVSWNDRWFLLKDSYIGYINPKTGTISDVLLMDRGFEVHHGLMHTGVAHGLLVSNLSRHLLMKCLTHRMADEWDEAIEKTAEDTARDYTQANRYEGFAPERPNTYTNWFVDAASYMAAVADALESAKEEIFITDWWLSPELYMKRPATEGDKWRLDVILKRKAVQGVKIFVLVYKEMAVALGINSFYTKQTLCGLHPNIKVMRHPDGISLYSHHEKIVCIDQRIAYLGGVDLCYGRWDTKAHRLVDLGAESSSPSSLSAALKLNLSALMENPMDGEVFTYPDLSQRLDTGPKAGDTPMSPPMGKVHAQSSPHKEHRTVHIPTVIMEHQEDAAVSRDMEKPIEEVLNESSDSHTTRASEYATASNRSESSKGSSAVRVGERGSYLNPLVDVITHGAKDQLLKVENDDDISNNNFHTPMGTPSPGKKARSQTDTSRTPEQRRTTALKTYPNNGHVEHSNMDNKVQPARTICDNNSAGEPSHIQTEGSASVRSTNGSDSRGVCSCASGDAGTATEQDRPCALHGRQGRGEGTQASHTLDVDEPAVFGSNESINMSHKDKMHLLKRKPASQEGVGAGETSPSRTLSAGGTADDAVKAVSETSQDEVTKDDQVREDVRREATADVSKYQSSEQIPERDGSKGKHGKKKKKKKTKKTKEARKALKDAMSANGQGIDNATASNNNAEVGTANGQKTVPEKDQKSSQAMNNNGSAVAVCEAGVKQNGGATVQQSIHQMASRAQPGGAGGGHSTGRTLASTSSEQSADEEGEASRIFKAYLRDVKENVTAIFPEQGEGADIDEAVEMLGGKGRRKSSLGKFLSSPGLRRKKKAPKMSTQMKYFGKESRIEEEDETESSSSSEESDSDDISYVSSGDEKAARARHRADAGTAAAAAAAAAGEGEVSASTSGDPKMSQLVTAMVAEGPKPTTPKPPSKFQQRAREIRMDVKKKLRSNRQAAAAAAGAAGAGAGAGEGSASSPDPQMTQIAAAMMAQSQQQKPTTPKPLSKFQHHAREIRLDVRQKMRFSRQRGAMRQESIDITDSEYAHRWNTDIYKTKEMRGALQHIHIPEEEDVEHKLWVGKDYVNFIHKDFKELDKPFSDFIDRKNMPRMPWHDIAAMVAGKAARDVARHFIQRWNFTKLQKRKTNPDYPLLLPKSNQSIRLPQWVTTESFCCTCQIVRSASNWSAGIESTEKSIHSAYVDLIERAKHYIYIENQFFVTIQGSKHVENDVSMALYERIMTAHKKNETFRVFVVMPLLPAFEGQLGTSSGSSIQAVTHWNYSSICRGGKSLLERLTKNGVNDPFEYISFFGLRSHAELNGKLTTELVYVHSKLMIVDDQTVIIGSANINDRSLLGTRDSEIAVVVEDTRMIPAQMNGKDYRAGLFASSLRKNIFREHLGAYDTDGPVDIQDPVTTAFYKGVWLKQASINSSVYQKVFHPIPSDNVTTYHELHTYTKDPSLDQTDPDKARQMLKKVKGHLVLLPLRFLCKENLGKMAGSKEAFLPSLLWT